MSVIETSTAADGGRSGGAAGLPPDAALRAGRSPATSAGSRLRRVIEDLSPARLFFGPVFQRDMRVLGRAKGTYWVRGGYALALCAFVSLFYVALEAEQGGSSGAARVQRLQEMAPMLALAIGWFQLATVLMVAPVLTAPAICDEKRNKSAAALATSPLTAAQILCSCLAGRVVQLAILMLMAAPLLLALRVFGGLDAQVVLGISAIVVTTGIMAAALALWGSVHARRASAAAGFALTWCLGICLLPLITLLLHFVVFRGSPPGRGVPWGWDVAVSMSPAFTLASMTMPGFPGGLPFGPAWVVNALSNLAVAAVVCLIASAQLRRVLLREAADSPPEVGPARPGGSAEARRDPRAVLASLRASLPAKVVVLVLGLLLPGVFFAHQTLTEESSSSWMMMFAAVLVTASAIFLFRRPRTGRVVGDAPVFWREWRQSPFGSSKVSFLLALGIAAIIGLAYANGGARESEFAVVFGVIITLVTILQTAAAAGNSIAGEVQARTWHALLTTPLPAHEIIMGKVLGVVRRAWPLAAVLGAHCAVNMILSDLRLIGILFAGWMLLSGVVFIATLGVALSLLLRRTTPATTWTVGIALAIWLVAPALVSFMFEIVGGGFSGDVARSFVNVLVSINPVPMVGVAIDGATGLSSTPFDMPHGNISTLGFLGYLAFGSGVLWAASAGVFMWAKSRFEAINSRIP